MGFFSAVKNFFKKEDAGTSPAYDDNSERPLLPSQNAADAKSADSAEITENLSDTHSDSPASSVSFPSSVSPATRAPSASSSSPSAPVSPASFRSQKNGHAESAPLPDEAFNAFTLALRETEPKLSAWLNIVLDGVEQADDHLWTRISWLLKALQTPQEEADRFIQEFRDWLKRMDYQYLDDFRSELQYRLALALDLEDEEDERDRLFLKVQDGLSRTRSHFSKGLAVLLAGHSQLNDAFWEDLEELFIMADMGAELSLKLTAKLRDKALAAGISQPDQILPLLEEEVEAIFHTPRRITAVNRPEVVLMVGVNGVGKTTTIAKLAYRERLQGKKVLIAGADTFRAAAVEQLEEWARRVDADFHSKGSGADPAAVAYEAMDKGLSGDYDVIFIDTAGRLHNKSNLMDELQKIRNVIAKKHPGAPHRTILVIDATTGQNALQQTKVFKESSGVSEIIITKLDGTAKGGVAMAVADQFETPITFIGLGEKMEDLRPFYPKDFAKALLGKNQDFSSSQSNEKISPLGGKEPL